MSDFPTISASVGSALHPAMALMARETRLCRTKVPRELAGQVIADGTSLLSGSAFLMWAEGGIGLFYRQGEGVNLDAPAGTDERDISLWLDGTLYAAIAAINGLLPLHASAVAHEGRVFAFSGQAGAGKSTLTAALASYGMPLFCDDTLILDLEGSGSITCLPGHKRLKLWPEGLAMSGAKKREQVALHYPKHFAETAAGVVDRPLPLAELIFLKCANDPDVCVVPAGGRMALLQDDHYTAELFAVARAASRQERFTQLASIASRLKMRHFSRPFDVSRFEEGTSFMARHIQEHSA